jgi:hypothetical protein
MSGRLAGSPLYGRVARDCGLLSVGADMPSLSLARFRINTVVMELRYPPAYPLWDRAGQLAAEIQSMFKVVELTAASPGQISFVCDNRFTVSVLLDKASVVDAGGNLDETTVTRFHSIFGKVLSILQPTYLTRIGTRAMYHSLCTSEIDASGKLIELSLLSIPITKFFDVNPKLLKPTYAIEVKDDELGYRVQLDYQTRKLAFKTAPEVASMGISPIEKEEVNIVLDLDLFTVNSTDISSYDTSRWLQRCMRLLKRDTDDFLAMGVRARV